MKTFFLLSVLLFVLVGLSACNKYKKPLGMEVGKYAITQYKTYPNGNQDTLDWIGYGPLMQGDEMYLFGIVDTIDYKWNIFTNSDDLSLYSKYSDKNFKMLNYESSEDKLVIDFTYREVFGVVSDSASGKIIFNRI